MAGRSADAVGNVLLDFQEVMRRFLETQSVVLASYSGTAPVAQPEALRRAANESPNQPDTRQRDRLPEPTPGGAALDTSQGEAPTYPPLRSGQAPEEAPIAARAPRPDTERVRTADAAPAPEAAPAPAIPRLARMGLRSQDRPRGAARKPLAAGHAVLIVDDGSGVGDELAARVRSAGLGAVCLAAADAGPESEAGVVEGSGRFVAPLADGDQVERAVARIASTCGPIAALVYLLPLRASVPFQDLDVASAWQRAWHHTRTLFLLCQKLRASLDAAAEAGASVLVVTGMGGTFASGARTAQAPDFFPGDAGVLGFAKCLAIEWPKVRVRCVDVDPRAAPAQLAEHLVEELHADEPAVEVGYLRDGRRLGLALAEVPADDLELSLPSDGVVLATGGARGITADVCLELAERFQPTFVLVGQTPMPPPVEPADTAALESPAELRRALLARLGRDGAKVTPAMVERAYRRLVNEREMRRNVGALTAAGARVHYIALDVRDDAALAALVAEIYATYGRLDGLIHGAGIIEDKLVRDKTVESFERVFATKVRSAFALGRSLRPGGLRFAVFFSSVAGRFGNRGQADYAAANEVVNKLAVWLGARWSARVCSLNWAPWDKRGMVTPELKREFAARGVGVVDAAAGRQAFYDEIRQSAAGAPVELVLAAAANSAMTSLAGESTPDPTSVPLPIRTPLIGSATPAVRATDDPAGALLIQRVLDVGRDRYLDDHKLDGRPVLPLAFATELMVEAAQAAFPRLGVIAVRELRLLKGVVLAGPQLAVDVSVRAAAGAGDGAAVSAEVDLAVPGEAFPSRYRATVDLAASPPGPPQGAAPDWESEAMPCSMAQAYEQWTFHGPLFQRVLAVDHLGADAIIGRITSPSASTGLRDVQRADWIFDPYVFDAALQLLLIWSRARNGKTALPSRFRSFRRFASMSDTPLTCCIRVASLSGGFAIRADVYFFDPAWRCLGVLEGMEASCSAVLNRLSSR